MKLRVSFIDEFLGACYTRSTSEPIGDTTVTEILLTEGFSSSHRSVLLHDNEGQNCKHRTKQTHKETITKS